MRHVSRSHPYKMEKEKKLVNHIKQSLGMSMTIRCAYKFFLMGKSIFQAFAIKFPLLVWMIKQNFANFSNTLFSLAVSGRRYWFNPLIKSKCQSKQWPAFAVERRMGKWKKNNPKRRLILFKLTRTAYTIFSSLHKLNILLGCSAHGWRNGLEKCLT